MPSKPMQGLNRRIRDLDLKLIALRHEYVALFKGNSKDLSRSLVELKKTQS